MLTDMSPELVFELESRLYSCWADLFPLRSNDDGFFHDHDVKMAIHGHGNTGFCEN